MGRQGQQAGLLLVPDVGDGVLGLVGVRALVGDGVPPVAELGVDVVEVAEGTGGEEGVAQVLDLALDLALLQGSQVLPVSLKHHRFVSPIRSTRSGEPASPSS